MTGGGGKCRRGGGICPWGKSLGVNVCGKGGGRSSNTYNYNMRLNCSTYFPVE